MLTFSAISQAFHRWDSGSADGWWRGVSLLLAPVAVLGAATDQTISGMASSILKAAMRLFHAPGDPVPSFDIQSETLSLWCAAGAISLLVGGLTTIGLREWRNPERAADRARYLGASRFLATVWLALAVAVQVGPLRTALADTLKRPDEMVVLVIALGIATLPLISLASLWLSASATYDASWAATAGGVIGRIAAAQICAWTFGFVQFLLWPTIYLQRLTWALDMEPEAITRAKLEAIGRRGAPTGAAVVSLDCPGQ